MIKHCIQEQIEFSKNLLLEIDSIFDKSNGYTDFEKKAMFEALFIRYPGNEYLLKKYFEFLRLANDGDILKEYELLDIKIGYQKLSYMFQDDIDLRFEKIYFDFDVMNEEISAKNEFVKVKQEILEKIKKVEFDLMSFNDNW